MGLLPEELSILANFTCSVNTRADGERMAARLGPVGRPQRTFYTNTARIRLYWTRDPAAACVLLSAFRGMGGESALFRDMEGVGEFVVSRRGGSPLATRNCCGVT